MSVLDAVILLSTLLAVARAAHLVRVWRSIPALGADPPPAGPLPRTTVAVAARDEGPHLERAARTWLRQDLPELEVIVADDRSTDDTPEVLARLAAGDSRLRPLRIERRPDGWLGKCHALASAARLATGEFVLFTDADVSLRPDTLRRALGVAVAQDADVVTLLPEVESDGIVQRAMTACFFQFFLTAMGGPAANRDDGRCAVGVGAFNLVRRSAYEAVGGHEPIRLQVGDDVALVRLLQASRFRHRLLRGDGHVRLRWQAGVTGTIRGLEKNFFWGARLSVGWILAFTLGSALLLAPLLAPLSVHPWAWACCAAWLAANAAPYAAGGGPGRLAGALLHPLSSILLVVAAWNSTVRTLRRGGISWRGDFFPLGDLRAALLPWRWWWGAVPARRARGG